MGRIKVQKRSLLCGVNGWSFSAGLVRLGGGRGLVPTVCPGNRYMDPSVFTSNIVSQQEATYRVFT